MKKVTSKPAARPATKPAATKKAPAKKAAAPAIPKDVAVEAYFAKLPADQQAALTSLRAAIRKLLPSAIERISYGIPTFRLERGVVGIGATKDRCALYVMSTGVMATLADELGKHDTGRGTVYFTPAKPLPAALVKKIVLARLAENATLGASAHA